MFNGLLLAEGERSHTFYVAFYQHFDFFGIPRDPGINTNPVPGSRDRQNGPGLSALLTTNKPSLSSRREGVPNM